MGIFNFWKKFFGTKSPLEQHRESYQSPFKEDKKEEFLPKDIVEGIKLEKFRKSAEQAEIIELVADEPKRARDTKGQYLGDDKSTPDVNEAWASGKAPKKRGKSNKKK
tara:strand:+ start:2296 stop:2619 length:324 start_codon:yes stop_codon:yes gene_type:complete